MISSIIVFLSSKKLSNYGRVFNLNKCPVIYLFRNDNSKNASLEIVVYKTCTLNKDDAL